MESSKSLTILNTNCSVTKDNYTYINKYDCVVRVVCQNLTSLKSGHSFFPDYERELLTKFHIMNFVLMSWHPLQYKSILLVIDQLRCYVKTCLFTISIIFVNKACDFLMTIVNSDDSLCNVVYGNSLRYYNIIIFYQYSYWSSVKTLQKLVKYVCRWQRHTFRILFKNSYHWSQQLLRTQGYIWWANGVNT